MTAEREERNKAMVLTAFDTLFNRRDYSAAEGFWSPDYFQDSAHIPQGRIGLFDLVRSLPLSLRYEAGLIVADGNYVMLHGRFSDPGLPRNWIVVDILLVRVGLFIEHWDVIQDEAEMKESGSGRLMFDCSYSVS